MFIYADVPMPRPDRSVQTVINRASRAAAYLQLADLLRARIVSGEIGPGELLPYEGRLSQEHGVGRATVRNALRVLRDEGLVVTERGYGTRVVESQEQQEVSVPRGSRVTSRMPSEAERAELGIEPGRVVPVLVVTLGGRVRGIYPADRTTLTVR